ncbi:MAG TPA: Hsp20/alpha crystallin family protein [Xanthobacteraceae bacterium]|jgi:HSP20 family molecular chaperone IbpA|nr:Hsp20/alpha crystallin family protein [Xanthobacteraceae bacterium]
MARFPARDVAHDWMWSEACEMLARAERMHRELFRPARTEARVPAWEPPVDILETEYEVLALVALPGVDADSAQAVIEDGDLVIAGTRGVPPELRTAVIHRLELPQGRFYRRVRLPAGRYSDVRRSVVAGCLVISLQKVS